MDIEIEIHVQIENIKPLLQFLKTKAKLKYKQHQVDEYFTPHHRDFTLQQPICEWLRLRKTDQGSSIAYKNWHPDSQGEGHHCDEYETSITNLSQLKKIFKALNFRSLVKVDKQRDMWTYKNYEISIDKVRGLGEFVEIEYKDKNTKLSPPQITKEMILFLKSLKLGKIERNYKGYAYLLMFGKTNDIEAV